MAQDYSQAEIDDLAEELREYSSRLSALFQVAYGFDGDPDRIARYVESETSYKDIIEDVDELLEEADEILESIDPILEENREEQLYRAYRRHSTLPESPGSGDWRDFYSEQKTIDNERGGDGLDYRSLLRAHNDTVLFLLNASRFDEELEELLPELKEDDAEIIHETAEETLDGDFQPGPVSQHQAEGLDLNEEERKENTAAYFFSF